MNEKQNQLNQDSLNQEQTKKANGKEAMSLEEWQKSREDIGKLLNAKWDFSEAGKTFVMPYKKRK